MTSTAAPVIRGIDTLSQSGVQRSSNHYESLHASTRRRQRLPTAELPPIPTDSCCKTAQPEPELLDAGNSGYDDVYDDIDDYLKPVEILPEMENSQQQQQDEEQNDVVLNVEDSNPESDEAVKSSDTVEVVIDEIATPSE